MKIEIEIDVVTSAFFWGRKGVNKTDIKTCVSDFLRDYVNKKIDLDIDVQKPWAEDMFNGVAFIGFCDGKPEGPTKKKDQEQRTEN